MWREFVDTVMNFFLSFIKLIEEKFNLLWGWTNPATQPPLSTSESDLEAGHSEAEQNIPTADGQSSNRSQPTNVQLLLIGVCATLVGITVQALKISEPFNSRSFHWICLALVFTLTAMLVSINTQRDYKRVSLLAVHAGIFIVCTALVVAFVINIPLPFKVISVVVYSIGILIIILVKLCKPKL